MWLHGGSCYVTIFFHFILNFKLKLGGKIREKEETMYLYYTQFNCMHAFFSFFLSFSLHPKGVG